MIGSLGAFALSMVNSFKRVVSPALVIAFAVLEGVFVGAFSKLIDGIYGDGLVVQAVLGTFAAFAGTLAAYKFFNIQVGQRFRTFVVAAMFGMVGLALVELVLGLFNSQLGLFGFAAARHPHRRRRPGARCVHADPRLRLRRAGHRATGCPSASRGARRSR